MMRVIHVAIPFDPDAFVILSMARRTYAALSHDGVYLHVIQPRAVDLVDANGTVLERVGELTCSCLGGIYRGTCWRTKQAVAFEAGRGLPDPAWLAEGFDAPVGAGEAVETFRG